MRKNIILCVTLIIALLLGGVSAISFAHKNQPSTSNKSLTYRVFGKPYQLLKSSKNFSQRGLASWYGRDFQNKETASGERYNMYAMTAAHKTLPLRTKLQVTNLLNGRQVIVRINDRGPFVGNRIIDLSYAAAQKLGMVGRGVAPVSIKAI